MGTPENAGSAAGYQPGGSGAHWMCAELHDWHRSREEKRETWDWERKVGTGHDDQTKPSLNQSTNCLERVVIWMKHTCDDETGFRRCLFFLLSASNPTASTGWLKTHREVIRGCHIGCLSILRYNITTVTILFNSFFTRLQLHLEQYLIASFWACSNILVAREFWKIYDDTNS